VGSFTVDATLGAAVILEVPGRRIALPVQSARLGGDFVGPFRWWYASNDCSGRPYMHSGQGSDLGTVADGGYNGLSAGKLIYSVAPWVMTPMISFRRWQLSDDPENTPAPCTRESATGVWGEVRVFDMRGFIPPFHVE